jgi:predicted enzyme related to lactoylglutathione lyase
MVELAFMPFPLSKEPNMILGLRTAIYPAPDLAAAKKWYADMLGLQPYFDQPFYVGFSVGGFELGLVPDATPGTTGPQPLWGVANADAAFKRLIDLGATALEPVTEVGEGIKVAAVTDPFGNRLGIIENPLFDKNAVR